MIVRFSGGLGAGKTYSMVAKCLSMFREKRGVQVYTNISSLACPEAIHFCDISQLCDISHGLVLLDEAAIIIPAQFWQDVGRELLTRFNQLRKFGLDLLYTSQRENGANVNLRDLTNETVMCSKLGPYTIQRKANPENKLSTGGHLVRRTAKIYGLYDTLETITQSGGSGGLAVAGSLSTVARRRNAEDERRKERACAVRERPLLAYHALFGWFGDQEHTYLPRPATEALAWLKETAAFDHGVPWHQQVRRELRRREWLKIWGLAPADAPVDCTPESPWLAGFDPQSVKSRWDAEQQEIEERQLAIKTAARGRGRPPAMSMNTI